jgi:ATP-dependent RNA helicase DeaD
MSSTTTFKQLGVIEPILQVCTEEEFTIPTEIQKKSIPFVIAGRDVIGEAATGSGKTLAFATGIIQQVQKGQGIQALVIAPTRELAQQVADMLTSLSKYKPLNITSIYGGVAINPQIRNLRKTDIGIGTPGRWLDHIHRGSINLKKVKILVLDEADRLLDMGFLPDVESIIDRLPEYRQTLLFSATIAAEVSRLAQKYMYEPIDVEAESQVDPRKLAQYYYGPVQDSLKFSLLVHLLKQEKNRGLSLIFCNTRRYADILEKNLTNSGIKATALHGGYSQHERTKRLNLFQNQRTDILVATDVAARGLDIPGVKTVYNYDLPENQKQYIHRIGRTARAGKAGKAITLVSQKDNEKFYYLFRDHRLKIKKMDVPYVKRILTPRIAFKRNSRNKQSRNRSTRKTPVRSYQQSQASRYSL